MYIGAVLCALISVAAIYQITVTNDVSNEWIIWLFVLVGFGLFGFGFVYETYSKKKKIESIS